MSIEMWGRALAAICLSFTVAACGGGDDGEMEMEGPPVVSEAPVATAEPADAPATIADLFPEAPAKQLVLSNCTSCHAVACAVIGQRPPPRWQELAEAHSQHVPSLSDEERSEIFTYLAANFSNEQPEPYVPAEFLERGCTPF